MKKVPDLRCENKKMHDSAETLTYIIIIVYLCERHFLCRALMWAGNHQSFLRQNMKLENGIASVSTAYCLLRDIDQEEFNNILMQWVTQLLGNRKLFIVLDGKGLRGATDRIADEKTSYLLNVLDVETKLVIARLPISMKSNEITGLPELLGILDLLGKPVTINAIGTQWKIMDIILKSQRRFI